METKTDQKMQSPAAGRRPPSERATIEDRHNHQVLLSTPVPAGSEERKRTAFRGMYLGFRLPIDLRSADLRGIDLSDADLTGRDFSDADFTGANLTGARYDDRTQWPVGVKPELLGAVRVPLDVSGANLAGQDFSHQDLTGANMQGANLTGANFAYAILRQVRMNGANVAGADFTGADLTDVEAAGVRPDENTRWPEGFNPKRPAKVTDAPPTLDKLVVFLKTLADPARLKILGMISSEEATVEEIADTLELAEATVSHHLTRLKELGLVVVRPDGTRRLHQTDSERLSSLLQSLPKEVVRLARGGVDPAVFEQKVYDAFFDGERLREMPMRSRKKQRIVLERIVKIFQPGERYHEKQLNEMLKPINPDVATLRRYMVDFRLLARENNVYWRI